MLQILDPDATFGGTWARRSKSGARVGPGLIPGLDGFIHTREQPSRHPFLKDVAKEIGSRRFYERLAPLAVLRCGCSVASLRAGSVTLTDEIPNILQGSLQCSFTIHLHSKLRETLGLDHPAPIFLGGAKESKKKT